MSMDRILVEDLILHAHHGVLTEEKRLGQQFLITLDMETGLRRAGKSDQLDGTVSYAEVCQVARELFTAQSFNLIEACAENLAEGLLLHFPPLDAIRVRVKKPWAPIGMPLGHAAVEVTRRWHRAYIGMGSNLGDCARLLDQAVERLRRNDVQVAGKSRIYVTKPVGPVPQPDYLNCVIALRTLLPADELLRLLLDVELEFGRERTLHWGPRTLDLDLLLYDDVVTDAPELVLPHPRMHERAFVLVPLCDVAPMVVHPLLHRRMAELLDALPEAAADCKLMI